MSGKPYRLAADTAAGTRIDRERAVSFTFDGASLSGFAGDTVASAVMAAGRRVFARSFKYHRPRGVFGIGSEEPNALIGIGAGARHEPNVRATQAELYDGLVAVSQNRWPSLEFDIGAVNNMLSRLFPSGFYYKTFMWPRRFWESVYEPVIRHSAGLGKAAREADPDRYEQIHVHCDVLVVGAGVAGLAAAEAAAGRGKRVILADENPLAGGLSDLGEGQIDGVGAGQWAGEVVNALADKPNVIWLPRTTVAGHYHHNYVLMLERVGDHDPALIAAGAPRHRLWKVRAGKVILASGAQERSIAFANNDRPGVMLASAAQALAVRHAVSPGLAGVVFTNNDSGYVAATAMQRAGVHITRIVDVRGEPSGEPVEQARAAHIDVSSAHAISAVETTRRGMEIEAVRIAPYAPGRGRVVDEERVACDFVAVAGGWNPAVHLWRHNGGKIAFDDTRQTFRPTSHDDGMVAVGAVNGAESVRECLEQGWRAGGGKARAGVGKVSELKVSATVEPIWFSPASGVYNEGNKHFVDLQNDVTVADVELAQREGYSSVEHTKRYTTLGMATDQGKTSNLLGLGVIAEATGKAIEEVGTTTFRPPFTPISFGAIAGSQRGERFLPVRRTPPFRWHEAQGADFEPVGHWRRPYCYRRGEEDQRQAIEREIAAVRGKVGLLDASTLGKIEVRGPDAAAFLDRVYTNTFSTLKVGRCRYGLMLNEAGFIIDDGVTARLGDDHFLMHTTSGGSDRVAAWLEEWLQTEWTDYRVFVTPVTEQWAQYAVAGPKARAVVEALGCDIDLDGQALPFMGFAEGRVGGYPVRLFRISFSGELSYELATPANYGAGLWQALIEAGKPLGLEVYGTEALHILRAEKGFIVVGDETDGTVTPNDVGMDWIVSKKKKDFIGKRSLSLPDLVRADRAQLVGLETVDPSAVLPDGAYAVANPKGKPPLEMIGHVTSSYHSPTLGRSIAMALIKRGRERMGETISFPLADGIVEAKIVEPVFYDRKGERQNV